MYDSRGVCLCSGASRREISKEMSKRGIVLMLVADAIDRLAIRLARRSRAIISVGFERARYMRKRRLWKRADGGSFLRTWCAGALRRWRCGGCARHAFQGMAWDRRRFKPCTRRGATAGRRLRCWPQQGSNEELSGRQRRQSFPLAGGSGALRLS
jgi:hypothetical protein